MIVVLGEAGTVRVTGRLTLPARTHARRTAHKILPLKPVSRSVAANIRTGIRLAFKPRVVRAVRKAFRRHARPRARVSVRVRDLNGNKVIMKRRVRLRR